MISVKRRVHFVCRDHGRKTIADAPRPADQAAPDRIPRISRLMALAIRFDRLIREGKVADISELARLAHVTQPRMTQIMNLNHLAPHIQEALLCLPRVTSGREAIHERMLRPVAAAPNGNVSGERGRRSQFAFEGLVEDGGEEGVEFGGGGLQLLEAVELVWEVVELGDAAAPLPLRGDRYRRRPCTRFLAFLLRLETLSACTASLNSR